MLGLPSLLTALAEERPVFHSEADFQHALAWLIQRKHPGYGVRLEYRVPGVEPVCNVDIWVRDGTRVCAIELKYKTRGLQAVVQGEQFVIAGHGAQPISRYDVLKDVARLEEVCRVYSEVQGYMVLLTNDQNFWNLSQSAVTCDAVFRIHEGACIGGMCAWAPHTGAGTTRNREKPLTLRSQYSLCYQSYSKLPVPGPSEFRCLCVPVICGESPLPAPESLRSSSGDELPAVPGNVDPNENFEREGYDLQRRDTCSH